MNKENMYTGIVEALEVAGLSADLYFDKFKKQKMTDTNVKVCLRYPSLSKTLEQIITVEEHLNKFVKAFKNLNTSDALESKDDPLESKDDSDTSLSSSDDENDPLEHIPLAGATKGRLDAVKEAIQNLKPNLTINMAQHIQKYLNLNNQDDDFVTDEVFENQFEICNSLLKTELLDKLSIASIDLLTEEESRHIEATILSWKTSLLEENKTKRLNAEANLTSTVTDQTTNDASETNEEIKQVKTSTQENVDEVPKNVQQNAAEAFSATNSKSVLFEGEKEKLIKSPESDFEELVEQQNENFTTAATYSVTELLAELGDQEKSDTEKQIIKNTTVFQDNLEQDPVKNEKAEEAAPNKNVSVFYFFLFIIFAVVVNYLAQ